MLEKKNYKDDLIEKKLKLYIIVSLVAILVVIIIYKGNMSKNYSDEVYIDVNNSVVEVVYSYKEGFSYNNSKIVMDIKKQEEATYIIEEPICSTYEHEKSEEKVKCSEINEFQNLYNIGVISFLTVEYAEDIFSALYYDAAGNLVVSVDDGKVYNSSNEEIAIIDQDGYAAKTTSIDGEFSIKFLFEAEGINVIDFETL